MDLVDLVDLVDLLDLVDLAEPRTQITVCPSPSSFVSAAEGSER